MVRVYSRKKGSVNRSFTAYSYDYLDLPKCPDGDGSFLSVIAAYLSEEGLQRLCTFIQIIDWTAFYGANRLQIQLTSAASPVLQAVSFENY